jgi:4-amino-4-deoxy-L-arabinose transferase-like glycosyltransferase
VWALFLVRGAFYCTMMPLWEGWDEYAHFAILQHWIENATLPRLEDHISREIDESMRLAPLAWELRWIGPPWLTHAQWWALPGAEREDRERRLAALPPSWAREPSAHPFVSYEAQQPPLYYWIVSQPLRAMASWPLASRVLFARLFSLLIASVAIPLTWLAARSVVGESGALFCAALLAVAPGFAIDTSRVANDCLAIALTALLLWLLTNASAGKRSWFLSGVVLGAALLAKAYLLALIPALAILWFRQKRRLALVILIAVSLSGWWYYGNLAAGHGLTGWLDRADARQLLSAVPRIDWFTSANIVAKSFIWFGGWSFLTLKSWMYVAVEGIAASGVVLALRSRNGALKAPFALSACYLLAVFYGVLVYFTVHRIPNLPGWYLWPIAGAFTVIVVAGLRRASIVLIFLLAALDLYGVMALLTPYYARLVERNRADGSQFMAALVRLEVPIPLAVLWIAATVAIPVISCWPNNKTAAPI